MRSCSAPWPRMASWSSRPTRRGRTSPDGQRPAARARLRRSAERRPSSVFYQKLDLDKIGAMGHSQGAGATAKADNDPRVKAAIYWNAGTSNEKPFLNVSGDRDVGGLTMEAMRVGHERRRLSPALGSTTIKSCRPAAPRPDTSCSWSSPIACGSSPSTGGSGSSRATRGQEHVRRRQLRPLQQGRRVRVRPQQPASVAEHAA